MANETPNTDQTTPTPSDVVIKAPDMIWVQNSRNSETPPPPPPPSTTSSGDVTVTEK